ncbi:hypothetical protein [Hyphomicrobium sp. LHD-15]|uniref:hypothetical protein n=1 Tax=Hyphomicrobium sp. LHD-15 TaxID=3072142 RepID=UPI00280E29BF|nr:hypothetical protein [Hyphomicrobium sp. LHD-15]MDQ8697497.1 hypothetical protein [Hyphomicrobium sp. LHD-15]
MNERVKAILLTALKLAPDEREELANSLLANLNVDPAETDQLFPEDAAGEPDAPATPVQRTSDVLAKYLDVE